MATCCRAEHSTGWYRPLATWGFSFCTSSSVTDGLKESLLAPPVREAQEAFLSRLRLWLVQSLNEALCNQCKKSSWFPYPSKRKVVLQGYYAGTGKRGCQACSHLNWLWSSGNKIKIFFKNSREVLSYCRRIGQKWLEGKAKEKKVDRHIGLWL